MTVEGIQFCSAVGVVAVFWLGVWARHTSCDASPSEAVSGIASIFLHIVALAIVITSLINAFSS